jgi:putative chitinase
MYKMVISLDQLCAIYPSTKRERLASFLDPINKTMNKYSIDTKNRVAMFLAQIGHESRCLQVVTENLNYKADRMLQVFPARIKSRALAEKLAHNPVAFANFIYADRMGNGSPESGDGYKFRGKGAIQLTGKDNHKKFADSLGMTLDQVEDYLDTPDGIIESAGWFWASRKLNAPAEKGDLKTVTKLINRRL